MMKRKRKYMPNGWNVAAVMIAVLGIIAGCMAFFNSTSRLLTEHQKHLEDISRSVDQNSYNLFSQIRQDLEYSVDHCLTDLSDSPIGREGLIEDLVMCDEEGTMQTLRDSVSGIRFHEYDQDGGICLCIDGKDQSYLAFLMEGEDGITYGALMKLEVFYQNIVVHPITFHYWVVFYDHRSNLMLQNEEDQPAYLIMEKDEISQRHDGYSILQNRELEGDSGTELYSYVHCDTGERIPCQESVLTSSDSLNREFAIGVAADTKHITSASRNTFLHLTVCSLLIVVSIAMLLYDMMHRTRQTREAREQLELAEQLLEKQTELARNQRLEALGVMTSSIAHEFNNLLTPITGYSLMCLESLPEENGELYENLLAIYQAADKARLTVRRFSALTQKNNDKAYTVVCPDDIVLRVEELAFPSKPGEVELNKALHCREITIRVNETQILQVLLNFLLNAFQALEKRKGTVTISTEKKEVTVVFSVADSGPGIDPEIMDRIFEPFFTTKETGKGSGLGLAIARQVAEGHGGKITVSSKPGEGTCFSMILPLYKC